MTTYRVRYYYTYVDEYEVEAETPEEADEVAEAFMTHGEITETVGRVTVVTQNEYVDYESGYVEAEDGEITEI